MHVELSSMRARGIALLAATLLAAVIAFGILAVSDFNAQGDQGTLPICHLTPQAAAELQRSPQNAIADQDCRNTASGSVVHPWAWTIAALVCLIGAAGCLAVLRAQAAQKPTGPATGGEA